jgi:hypothetical protein
MGIFIYTAARELVVDLLLEQQHLLGRQLFKDTQHALSPKKAVEACMAVGVVFCTAEDTLSLGVYFLVMVNSRS